jgi:hypothetical protein
VNTESIMVGLPICFMLVSCSNNFDREGRGDMLLRNIGLLSITT